jgi:hypothetical protein
VHRAATSVARLMAIVHVARLMAIVHRPGTSLARCPGRTGRDSPRASSSHFGRTAHGHRACRTAHGHRASTRHFARTLSRPNRKRDSVEDACTRPAQPGRQPAAKISLLPGQLQKRKKEGRRARASTTAKARRRGCAQRAKANRCARPCRRQGQQAQQRCAWPATAGWPASQ